MSHRWLKRKVRWWRWYLHLIRMVFTATHEERMGWIRQGDLSPAELELLLKNETDLAERAP